MALITVTASKVHAVEIRQKITAPVTTSTSAGHYVKLYTTNGRLTPGYAAAVAQRGQFAGIAIRSEATLGTVTAVVKGIVELGKNALTSLSYGDKVYLSTTKGSTRYGRLSTTTGTVSTGCAVVGIVGPAFGHTTADKVLYVDIRPQNHAG